MKRIGFITDDIELKEPLSTVLGRFDDGHEFQVETINRLSPDIPAINKVLSLIRLCDTVVFFIGKGASNIYYEIGLAHASNKNVILMTSSHNLIPLDLSYQKYILVEDKNFEKAGYEIFTALQGQTLHHDRWFHDIQLVQFQTYFKDYSPALKFRDLYAFSGSKRTKMFERWFVELAKNVNQWKVIESESKLDRDAFDLMLWNSADDPDFSILGNPIPVELKALNAMNSHQLDLLAQKLSKQGLRSLILATTGVNRTNPVRLAKRIRQQYGVLIVALDRDDLIDIDSSKDLYFALKRQLLNIAFGE